MRSFAAFLLCLVAGLALYPALIGMLARQRAGQRISGYGPATHLVKAGTPTMGGLLFCLLAAITWLLLDHSRAGFVVVFAVLAGGGLGLLDDLDNIRGRGALGLLARQKLALQALIGLLVGIGLHQTGLTRQVFPGLGAVDFGWGVLPLATVAVMACSNAVNLTDGVDGLAAGCSVLTLSATWALAVHVGNRPAAVLSAALVGGLCAFLAYNWHPARVFMGDTGALALGSVVAVLAAELRLLWLLPLLGVVFLAETLSVIINVTAIRRYGVHVFRSSPIHHHFELLGLREQALVVRFAAVAGAGAALAVLVALPMGAGS
ncbi:MAG: phospho-N-acetylmuramoyl-pentapeptide-transferase [Chloroflexi bacterium]|nr:MAG: phospho-N-acetylmuramoyl-pentapeptide-transferase [Chloroflexota bacterium]